MTLNSFARPFFILVAFVVTTKSFTVQAQTEATPKTDIDQTLLVKEKPEVICKNGNKLRGHEIIIEVTPQVGKNLLATIVKKTIQKKSSDALPQIKPMSEPVEVTKKQSGVQRDYEGAGFHLYIPLESFVPTKTHTGTLVMLDHKGTKIDFSCVDQK